MGEVRWAVVGRLGPEPGTEPQRQAGPGHCNCHLGIMGLRHKEKPTILVELPLATRLLSVLVCAHTVVFFQLPTSPPSRKKKKKGHIDGDPTIHLHLQVCHPCIDVDRPAIDATDTAVDQGTPRSSLKATAQSLRPDAMQRPLPPSERHERMLDQLSLPVPSIPSSHPNSPIHPLTRSYLAAPTSEWSTQAGCRGCHACQRRKKEERVRLGRELKKIRVSEPLERAESLLARSDACTLWSLGPWVPGRPGRPGGSRLILRATSAQVAGPSPALLFQSQALLASSLEDDDGRMQIADYTVARGAASS